MKIWKIYYIIDKAGLVYDQYPTRRAALYVFNKRSLWLKGMRIEAYAECSCNNGGFIRTAKADTMTEAVAQLKSSFTIR